jgi:hypothetical protein
MKLKMLGWALVLMVGLIAIAVFQSTQPKVMAAGAESSRAAARLQRNDASGPRNGIVAFLLSPRGRKIVRASSHPMAQALLRRLGEEPRAAAPESRPAARPASFSSSSEISPASIGCGTASGTRFNREPRTPPDALPQNSPSVDFLFGSGQQGGDLVVGAANDFRGFFGGLGDSGTGYYVHRNGGDPNPCTAQFEGGLPQIVDSATGEALLGGGDPVVEADPARNAIYVADIRIGSQSTAIALFRATATNLNNATACPNGTHTTSQSQTCWPVKVEVNPKSDGSLLVLPHLAVDPRTIGSGTGAGDVYISGTIATPLFGNLIFLAACKNDLSSCSPGAIVSGSDSNTDASHVRVRPDIATKPNGSVTVTYVNVSEGPPPDFAPVYDIKYVTCTPSGAPSAPSCSFPTLIKTESQPISFRGGGLGNGSLATTGFPFATFPKHDHRQDQNGVETYVVWDRCKVVLIAGGGICPDADVSLAASSNNGQSWTFADLDAKTGDQYFPWIATDVFTNIVNVAYYSTTGDIMNHRPKVLLVQIAPGPSTPDPVGAAQTLTTVGMEPSGDFFLRDAFIGNRISVSARGTSIASRAYVHYVHNAVAGVYNGASAPEQNNHMSQFSY